MNRGSVGRTVATLAGLTVLFPATAAVVGGALIARTLAKPKPKTSMADAKTVLINGGKMTKALQLARSFDAAGHRVVLAESEAYWVTGHRYSRAVDRFATLPESGSDGYADALAELVADEGINVFIPVSSPVGSLHDSAAMAHLPASCETIHADPDTITLLDDKHKFAETAAKLGLRVPKSVLITDPAQIAAFDFSTADRPYILKSIAYDPVRRLDLTQLPLASPAETAAYAKSLPIRPDNPWVMQEFIAGTEYCTHGTFRDGRLTVHACCMSSPFQVNYAHFDRPDILEWVTQFGAGLALTGQASFDFIEADDDGAIYAIECNPRTHSAITMFYNHPDLAAAYLGERAEGDPIEPLPSSRPTYWLAHEIWRIVRGMPSFEHAKARLRVILHGKDAVFDWRDPLPFLALHHWHVPALLLRTLRDGRDWLRIDFNIGKLVQTGGD